MSQVNATPFNTAPSTEEPDEAASPDVSEAAMSYLRSPFEPVPRDDRAEPSADQTPR